MKTIKSLILMLSVFAVVAANAQTVTTVNPGKNTVVTAVKVAAEGDVLELTDGEYIFTTAAVINKNVTIRAAKGATPVIKMRRTAKVKLSFCMRLGVKLVLDGLTFEGSAEPAELGASNYALIVQNEKENIVDGAEITIKNCTFQNYVCVGANVIRLYPNTMTKELNIENCKFVNCRLALNCAVNKELKEGDTHNYNVEKLNITNTLFDKCSTSAIVFEANSSTDSDISLNVDHCVFNDCGKMFIITRRVATINLSNSIFAGEGQYAYRFWANGHVAKNCCVAPTLKGAAGRGVNINTITEAPKFEEGTFKLASDSPLKGKATDGSDIGLK